ncbi:MAG: sigma-70 family RNA polymerase sigma factor [Candidatus Gastranaerophilales bacterium]
MELEQDKIKLIEKVIKNDKKFTDNEDLYEDFLNETCKRSLIVIKSIRSSDKLEAYLKKVTTTAILDVLKNSGRVKRTQNGFMSTDEKSIDFSSNPNKYNDVKITYHSIGEIETPEDIIIKKDTLTKILGAILQINKENPEKNYLNIYKLRFEKELTQKEIAVRLGLTQSEISKRLFKLMDKVREIYN